LRCKVNERIKGEKGSKYLEIVLFKEKECPGKYKIVPKRKPVLKELILYRDRP